MCMILKGGILAKDKQRMICVGKGVQRFFNEIKEILSVNGRIPASFIHDNFLDCPYAVTVGPVS